MSTAPQIGWSLSFDALNPWPVRTRLRTTRGESSGVNRLCDLFRDRLIDLWGHAAPWLSHDSNEDKVLVLLAQVPSRLRYPAPTGSIIVASL